MNSLEQLDQILFFFFNHTLHNRWLDSLMPYWRSMYLWLPLYVFMMAYWIERFGKKGILFTLAIALTVGVADICSSRIIKYAVERPRPCNDGNMKEKVKLLVRCGSGYSFTSSHATNHFAIASFLFFSFFKQHKRLKWLFVAWAASIALGQVYVGVHYPFDVLCGALLGCAIGFLGVKVLEKYYPDGLITAFPDMRLQQHE